MNWRNWIWSALLALPLAAGGIVYANSRTASYTCPLTGEQLPCEKCCPLNQEQSYTCPLTGEDLPCANCCPLNQGN